MGSQTPSAREQIRRKERKRIKELIDVGDIESAATGIMQSNTILSIDFDIVSTIAIAKTYDIIETKTTEEIKDLARKELIHKTSLSYITETAIKFAENKTNIKLEPHDKKTLEASLKEGLISKLGDNI